MLVYLDSVICIYAVEGAPSFQARAKAKLANARAGIRDYWVVDINGRRLLVYRDPQSAHYATRRPRLNGYRGGKTPTGTAIG